MQPSYDFLIIGSGFGGSVMACRLAQAQRDAGRPVSVCVLERGRRYHRREFPRAPYAFKDWWWQHGGRGGWTGLIDFCDLGDISVGMAAGVGGTSLIYLDVQIDAFDSTWDVIGPEGRRRWPESVDWRQEMPRYYRRIKDVLNPTPVPNPPLKIRAMKEAARAIGEEDRFRLLDVAVYWGKPGVVDPDPYDRGGPPQTGCDYCGECYIGCNSHSKNTMDLTYLWLAQKAGAEVHSLHNVTGIEPNDPDHPRRPGGYTVHFDDLRWGMSGSVSADRLIVSAGSVHSTELLLRSKYGYQRHGKHHAPTLPELSDMLGRYFSGNGDFGAIAFETNRAVHPMDGPTITGVLDYRDKNDGRGFLIEEGGFPDIIRSWLRRIPGGLSLGTGILRRNRGSVLGDDKHEWIKAIAREFDFDASRDALWLLVMGGDEADGILSVDEKGHLQAEWDTETNMPFFREIEQTLRDLFQEPPPGIDGNIFLNPTWTTRKHLITVHPLGGCPMGESPETGVVSPTGEVHNYPGLYVMDGSVVPSALGANPSKTIGALAERAAEKLIENLHQQS
mgnify:CR=1 FL=1